MDGTLDISLETLRDWPGQSLALWRRERVGGWRQIPESVGEPADPELVSWLETEFGEGDENEVAVRSSGGMLLSAMRLSGPGEAPSIAVGSRDDSAESLAQWTLDLVKRDRETLVSQVEQRTALSAYAAQVSADFEELTFLRRIARHIEYCDVNQSVADVARSILPTLRELIAAEGIAFLETPIERADACPLSEQSAEDAPRLAVTVAGKLLWKPESCSSVLACLNDRPRRATLVWNTGRELSCPVKTATIGELQSLIATPVTKEGLLYGWIVATNKISPWGNPVAPEPSTTTPRQPSEGEFGTIEASLFEATATLLATHACNARRFREQESLVFNVIRTLMNVIDAKDSYTCGHSDRVAIVARRLAQELGLSTRDCETIFLSGLLHDIGKLGLADDVLLKPGLLTAHEYADVMEHPLRGYRLLKDLAPLRKLLPGVLHHHEAIDGTGYPYRLRGKAIPLMARIIAVADAYDAMTSDRPYRQGMSMDKAGKILQDGAGRRWDREVVAAFSKIHEEIVDICENWQDHIGQILSPSQLSSADSSGTTQDLVHRAVKQAHVL